VHPLVLPSYGGGGGDSGGPSSSCAAAISGEAAARLAGAALMYAVVYAHNDLLSGNILAMDGSGSDGVGSGGDQTDGARCDRVQLIDYEYGGYNYAGHDVANHFCEHAGFDFDLDRWYPGRQTQADWLAAYVQRRGAPATLWDVGSSDAAVAASAAAALDEMVTLANRFTLTSHLWWGLWAVVQARHSPIDFDFMSYALQRFAGYDRHKREFWGASDGGILTAGAPKAGEEDGCAAAPAARRLV
jgi:ethanolamine kinase